MFNSSGHLDKTYKKQLNLLEKRRKKATSRALTRKEIDVLLSLRWNNKPQYKSVECVYSEEYKKILKMRNRAMTKEEFKKLIQMKDRDGNNKYREENLQTFDGKYRSLTEEQAKDLCGYEKFGTYRPATTEEANILYCDIHSRHVLEGLE